MNCIHFPETNKFTSSNLRNIQVNKSCRIITKSKRNFRYAQTLLESIVCRKLKIIYWTHFSLLHTSSARKFDTRAGGKRIMPFFAEWFNIQNSISAKSIERESISQNNAEGSDRGLKLLYSIMHVGRSDSRVAQLHTHNDGATQLQFEYWIWWFMAAQEERNLIVPGSSPLLIQWRGTNQTKVDWIAGRVFHTYIYKCTRLDIYCVPTLAHSNKNHQYIW